MWHDTVLILLISICTAFLGEGLTWFLLYRTEKYKTLKNEVERQCKQIEKMKEFNMNLATNKQAKKKLDREEEKLKSQNRDLSMAKMKAMALAGVIFTILLSTFNNWFSGRVVAKLPFIPIGFIQGLSHRNLPGDDLTDCSFIFLYVLCTMSIRQNLQKLLGFAPSRAAQQQAQSIFQPSSK